MTVLLLQNEPQVATAGPVTQRERRQAATMERDRAKLERAGIRAALQAAARYRLAVLRFYRAGRDPFVGTLSFWEELTALLRDHLLVVHLYGFQAARRDLPVATEVLALQAAGFVSSPYKEAVRFLEKSSKLTDSQFDALRRAYGKQAVDVVNSDRLSVQRRLRARMADITRAGEHVREGVKQLGEEFNSLGLTPRNSFHLEAVYRTQTAMAYAAGRAEIESDPDIQEILWGYKYVTVGDQRVRPAHRALEGTTLPKEHVFWKTNMPPNGWACRCKAIPIYEPRDEVEPPDKVLIQVGKRGKERMIVPGADKGFRFNPGEVGVRVLHGKVKQVKPPIPRPKPTPKPKPTPPVTPPADPVSTEVLRQDYASFEDFRRAWRASVKDASIDVKLQAAKHLDDDVAKLQGMAGDTNELRRIKGLRATLESELGPMFDALHATPPPSSERYRWLLERIDAHAKRIESLIQQEATLKNNYQAAHEFLYSRGATQKVAIDARPTIGTQQGAFPTAADEVTYLQQKQVAEEWINQVMSSRDDFQGFTYQANRRGVPRAWAFPHSLTVECHETTGYKTWVHEIFHLIENATGSTKGVNEFHRYRLLSSPAEARKLRFFYRQQWGKGLGYEKSEVGFQDKWDLYWKGDPNSAHYTGKWYGGKKIKVKDIASSDRYEHTPLTEILTMGMQEMFSNPIGMAQRDPEWCKFLLGILDGTLP